MTTELRRALRYPIVTSVEVRELDTGIRVHARTSDLSIVGCYVDTLNPLPAGTGVELQITHDSETVTIGGVVAYCKNNLGMGIEFDSVRRNQLKVLRRWIDKIATLQSESR